MGTRKVTAKRSAIARLVFAVVSIILTARGGIAATISTHPATSSRKQRTVKENPHAGRRIHHLARRRRVPSRTVKALKRRHYYEHFYASSYARDVTDGDITAGEDPVVRLAAIDAIGNMNGTVLAIEPTSGRILAMVNQKLALQSGAQPCSTIKLSVALAALSEGIITKETRVRLGGRYHMNLTLALAHSNNAYFEALGRRLGFEKVARYAHLYGLGELAGYHIEGESPGVYPEEEISSKLGGVGKMCSFGEGISMTPLQLGALVTAIANGGTMYYLQHPTTPAEVANFQPIVKRHLDIAGLIPEISDGLAGAVVYGTAKRLLANFNEEEVLGKTGTCSHDGTRFGWFASYANTEYGRLVVVVFLEGGRPTFGPKAAEIAGHLYRNLYDHDFFAEKPAAPAEVPVKDTPNN
ncbi:MAG: penicillin-binding protein [Acidobacteria bacterium]|nr:penicillin-binding protein [Acidobacteriota bacterium]